MDSITRFRLRMFILQVGAYSLMGVALACLSLIMPFINRDISQLNADAGAFVAIVIATLAGIVHAAIMWVRGGRLQREMKARGELP